MSQTKVSATSSSGIGFMGVLFIVLLILKVAGIGSAANWSWWIVFIPFWGPLVVAAIIVIGGGLIGVLAWIGAWLWQRLSKKKAVSKTV